MQHTSKMPLESVVLINYTNQWLQWVGIKVAGLGDATPRMRLGAQEKKEGKQPDKLRDTHFRISCLKRWAA